MFKQYAELFNELTPNLTDPDITFFFQRDIDELFMFKERRNRPNEEYITREYLTNIHLNYLEDFKKHPGKKIVIVDVTGMDFVNNESDYRKVLSIMDRDYEPKITTIENDVVKSLAA